MRLCLVIVLIVLVACTKDPSVQDLRVSNEHNLTQPHIQFLGVGGWLLHWKGEGLMLAPSFSNPGLFGLRGVPSPLVLANERKIDKAMREVRGFGDVQMMLVGHGHYDHLLDVPWIVEHYMPGATIYGSETVKHILHGFDGLNEVQVVDVPPGKMARLRKPGESGPLMREGEWITSEGGHIRVMPIESEHAGHVAGLNLIPGGYRQDLTKPELSLWRWKPGQSLAWVIDLMDDKGEPVYRIHYQDSAATPPFGFVPDFADKKAIDVEILCASSWIQVPHYPQRVLERHRPRMVLIGHWENFFANDPHEPRLLVGQDVRAFIQVVQTTVGRHVPVILPAPLSEVAFPRPEKKPPL
ncbi:MULTISPECIES: MBL fold metallo-hydrolase [unclassified Pseudomonas]|uniref:MBL fold metallo-hydrolase n=1 Tax=unclassified Pseudomonas TaxID=196821 RepID=UPI000A1E38CA|nr:MULTISPECIES: MBL fold metallo-hydrolase [unclassified Pseudomonas]